jgi:hypothetical protein
MRHRTAAFSLVWALILFAVFALLAAGLFRVTEARTTQTRAFLDSTLASVTARNDLSYAGRLLAANATRIVRSLPETPNDPTALTRAAQQIADSWCTRTSTASSPVTFRIYFTQTACGQALPAGIRLDPVTSQPGALTTVQLPFVLVTRLGTGPQSVRTGWLGATYGAFPLAATTLYVPGDLTLSPRINIQGTVQVDGQLTLNGTVKVTDALTVSGCGLSAPECRGEQRVTVGSSTFPVMQLTPAAERPCLTAGCLQGGSLSTGAGGYGLTWALPSASVPVIIPASTLRLGVTFEGVQVLQACNGGTCTLYTATRNGDRTARLQRQDSVTGQSVVVQGRWDGMIVVPNAVTVSPLDANSPSVGLPLTVSSLQPLRVEGNLTYVQTNCTDTNCTTGVGGEDMLALISPAVRVEAERLHAAILTASLSNPSELTIYGAVTGTPSGPGALRIQQDPRFRSGLTPRGVPVLPSRWREAVIRYEK